MENGVYQVLDKEGNVIDYAEISDGNVYYFGADEYDGVNHFMERNENNKLQLINKPVSTTNEQPKFTLNQVKFAFLCGRNYNNNYHFDEMLKDKNFLEDNKNVWDKG